MGNQLDRAAAAWISAERNRAVSKAEGGLPGLDRIADRYDSLGFACLCMALNKRPRSGGKLERPDSGEALAEPVRQDVATCPGEGEEL